MHKSAHDHMFHILLLKTNIPFDVTPFHCTPLQTNIHTFIYTYTYIYTYIHTYLHTYIYTYIHACLHACLPACILTEQYITLIYPYTAYITLQYSTVNYDTLRSISLHSIAPNESPCRNMFLPFRRFAALSGPADSSCKGMDLRCRAKMVIGVVRVRGLLFIYTEFPLIYKCLLNSLQMAATRPFFAQVEIVQIVCGLIAIRA